MKRMLALLVALIMAFSLFACSQDASNKDPEPSQPSAAPVTSTPEPSATEDEEDDIPLTDAEALGFPLADGDITLTWWWPLAQEVVTFIEDMNDNIVFRELQKLSGVNFEFITPSPVGIRETFNLLIAGQSYPDVFKTMIYYSGRTVKAVEDGVCIDPTDLMNKYAPNYITLINSADDYRRGCYTDDGRVLSFIEVHDRKQASWSGLLIRGDWLDEIGHEMPQTIDQLHDTLVEFKQFTGEAGPLQLGSTGVFPGNFLIGSLYSSSTFLKDPENPDKVTYGPMTEGYKEYLALMRQWYSERLLDQEFVTRTESNFPVTSLLSADKLGGYIGIYNQAGSFYYDTGVVQDPSFYLRLAPRPVKNIGDPIWAGMTQARIMNTEGGTISTDCKYPEIAIKLFDYFYSEDGALLCNYGVEGETFEYDENGQPWAKDIIVNNPEGMLFNGAQFRYLMHTGPHLWIQDREDLTATGEAAKYVDLWEIEYPGQLPGLSLPGDLSMELSGILVDINTLVEEFTVQTIMGLRDLESEWDEYVDKIKSMDIARAIEIQQTAYDNYLAR
jgi:putative aldouronate transport system substrate-binding protein